MLATAKGQEAKPRTGRRVSFPFDISEQDSRCEGTNGNSGGGRLFRNIFVTPTIKITECPDSDSDSSEIVEVFKKRRFTSIAMEPGAAVVIRDAEKWYKSGQPVLSELNMTVPCGSIYALLGHSGCGKTTLLSCIVGVKKLNHGGIWVFGGKPGGKSVGVPGRNVGYMPQETSLYMDFTIEEILIYFGTFAGMSNGEINTQTEFLSNLLELPDVTRRIGSLSGGQQRRVSFAVALIHDPELLVLDEPTVGVDATLREKIWAHLKDRVSGKRTTVIITTHYIEEARKAHTVGVLRRGRLLVEKPPLQILSESKCSSLEKGVLQLCSKDSMFLQLVTKLDARRNSQIANDFESNVPNAFPAVKMATALRKPERSAKDSFAHLKALTRKNFIILCRNLLLLLFVVWVVPLQYIVVSQSIGNDPTHLPLGVVNNERINSSTSYQCLNITRIIGECNVEGLSCRYLSYVPKSDMDLKYFKTEDEAMASVQNGFTWGYLIFPHHFSTTFWERAASAWATVDEITFNLSRVIVKLDQTNKQITIPLSTTLHNAFKNFTDDLMSDCGFDPRQGELALQYKTPIFGRNDTDFREFIAPAGVINMLFFFSAITASIRYIHEKKSRMLERTLVAGVSTWEIIVAYSLSEFCVLLIEALLCFAVLLVFFQIELLGSPILLFLLLILAGYGGVSMGLLLGTICSEEIQASLLGMAFFFPNFVLSGQIWPVEGMPEYFQYIAQVLPSTLPAEAARSINSRGWEFTHPNVWPGFAVFIAYIFVFSFLTVIFHKLIRR